MATAATVPTIKVHCPPPLAQVFGHLLPSVSQAVLALHDSHRRYDCFAAFQPDLVNLLNQAALLDDCVALTRELGFLEPLTDRHIPPEAITIQGPNYRESLLADGLLSRNRAVLRLLVHLYGSLAALQTQQVYLVEALLAIRRLHCPRPQRQHRRHAAGHPQFAVARQRHAADHLQQGRFPAARRP